MDETDGGPTATAYGSPLTLGDPNSLRSSVGRSAPFLRCLRRYDRRPVGPFRSPTRGGL